MTQVNLRKVLEILMEDWLEANELKTYTSIITYLS